MACTLPPASAVNTGSTTLPLRRMASAMRRSTDGSAEGSDNNRSRPSAAGDCWAMRSIRSICWSRLQGQRPTFARLASSMATTTMSWLGAAGASLLKKS